MKAFSVLSSIAAWFGQDTGGLKTATYTTQEMVVTAHPDATAAGAKILAAGGTAADALVAIQTVLNVVEPQSSGVGGGAFLLYYNGKTKKLTTIDAREKAPDQATENRFIDPNTNETLSFYDAWQSALGVGVPGVPLMLVYMQQTYGNLLWKDLFDDAKNLATNGFVMSNRTHDQVNMLFGLNEAQGYNCEERLYFRDPVFFDYLAFPNCTAKPAGTILKNPDYADFLDLFATQGPAAFYTGQVAQDIVAKVGIDRNPSGDAPISLDDLLHYEIVERDPVCKTYRNKYNVCGMGPPSSGGIAVGQTMGILENFNMSDVGPRDVDTVHLFAEAGRLVFADRNLYVGDTDFVTVPVEGMLDADYLKDRASLINMNVDMGHAKPGVPPGNFDALAPQTKEYGAGTSQISIVDQYGNAISVTTTVEHSFGSGLMTHGFLLNNQLTDFSFNPTGDGGTPVANRVQPSKRPRSSMAPTIVLDMNGNLAYLTGSPGGSRIIGFTALSVLVMLEFGLNPQEAANEAQYLNRNGPTELEVPKPGITVDYDYDRLKAALEARNHTVIALGGEGSGLGIIEVLDTGFVGGADPRRDGTVAGRDMGSQPPAESTMPAQCPCADAATIVPIEGRVASRSYKPDKSDAAAARGVPFALVALLTGVVALM